jgi:hypothetical protein
MNLNNPRNDEILQELYYQSCSSLLSANGIRVHVQAQGFDPPARKEASYVSALGAGGDGIRLSSLLLVDQNLVIDLYPLDSTDGYQPELEDWCLELNNQLVGRLKNKLLGYGRTVMAGLPLLLLGTDISAVAPHPQIHRFSVGSADGQIAFSLAVLIAPGIELRALDPLLNDEIVMAEGAIRLF